MVSPIIASNTADPTRRTHVRVAVVGAGGGRGEVCGEIIGDIFGNFVFLDVEENHEHKQKTLEGCDGPIRGNVLLQPEHSLLHLSHLLHVTRLAGGGGGRRREAV